MQGLAEIAHPQTAGLPPAKRAAGGRSAKRAAPAAKSKRPAKKKR
jgi:hypothetical protein